MSPINVGTSIAFEIEAPIKVATLNIAKDYKILLEVDMSPAKQLAKDIENAVELAATTTLTKGLSKIDLFCFVIKNYKVKLIRLY